MNASLRVASIALLSFATAACGESSSSESSSADRGAAPGASDQGAPAGDGARAIAEADIVQLDPQRGRLYAMSKSGSLAIVDVSTPGRLALLGKTRLPGEPFEMYLRGDLLLTMANGAFRADGEGEPLAADDAPPPARDLTSGAIVTALDVASASSIRPIESFKIAGQIADSRLVGDVLYLATYETGSCWRCTSGARTLVTSFDVSRSTALDAIDQVAFTAPQSTTFNAAWSTPWKRSIVVTSERMYVGGLASLEGTGKEGVIEVLDITDPGGKLVRGPTLQTAGPIMSRWQADEHQGVLRVISQRGAGSTANGSAYPEIETFSTSTWAALGNTTMRLPRQEGLKTVRFDGDRAYAITFNQTDPLFALDLSDPTRPVQKGELHMPGWMFHLEPHGDRVIGLGLDRNDPGGSLNVSLFDVSDLSAPKLLDREPFGPTYLYEDYQITSGVLAEDQDRIQKAFSVSNDGLVAVPFSGRGGCGTGGGVQLLEWRGDALAKRALLPMAGNPRRTLRKDGELIAVSDSNVRSFSLARTDVAAQTADLVIGTCVQRTTPYGSAMNEGSDYYYDGDYRGGRYGHCSMGAPSPGTRAAWPLAIVGLAAAVRISRRRRAAGSR